MNEITPFEKALPVDMALLLKQEAEGIAKRVGAPQGHFIKITQDKKFQLPDGLMSSDPIKAIIVDFASANYYYPNAYNQNSIETPVCFAIGLEPGSLVPSTKSSDRQSEDCAGCPQNAWGSSGRGNSKACKNSRVLALMMPDEDVDSPMYLLRVSPTGIRAFDAYVSAVARVGTSPIGVVTTISFDPNSTYASLRFEDPVPNPIVQHAFARREEARAMLLAEPDFNRNTKSDDSTPTTPSGAPKQNTGARAGVISRVRR